MATADLQEKVPPLPFGDRSIPPLQAGDHLSREEFLRIWELHPEIKRAELIGGMVYMPSPLSVEHGDMEGEIGGWLFAYKSRTPGTAVGHNATSFFMADTPQADVHLRILTECGGNSWTKDKYLAGTPELFVEICLSSAAYDLHQKFKLYQSSGVPEYLTVLMFEREIRWHVLVNGAYQVMPPGADGLWRSRIFPGLWLDGPALLAGDSQRLLARLDEGLRSTEHEAFVAKLAKARAKA
jgi:Uma2 family endonuclease